MSDDEVFKALADPSRRKILDLLFQRDGQTLTELESNFTTTRFACMKHLQVLEDAGIITSRKVGREKFHYLNPMPIQLVYDRWVSKYAQPFTRTLAGLKFSLEENDMNGKPSHVYQIFIQTTPEKLWQALTDKKLTPLYYFGSPVESKWEKGATYRYPNPNGGAYVDGEILEIDPPRKLVSTFRPLFQIDPENAPWSKVTWEIMPMGNACKLVLTHDNLELNSSLTESLKEGWAQIISGLKTLLETGEPLLVGKE
jgi:uncharacterized protein YndB with AHSA1/START domain/DNA-binding transcriptional ArsR family regulator